MAKYVEVIVGNNFVNPIMEFEFILPYSGAFRLFKKDFPLSNGETFSLSDGADIYLVNRQVDESKSKIPYGQFKDGMVLPQGIYHIMIEGYGGRCESNLIPDTITQYDLIHIEQCPGSVATYPYGVLDTYGHHHD